MSTAGRGSGRGGVAYIAALAAPIGVTAALVPLGGGVSRDYVFVYLAVVAVLGVAVGVGPAVVAAIASFLLVDWFFVQPLHTLTIADRTDVVNLIVFTGAALLVGGVGSRRRRTQIRAETLAGELRVANVELERLNREQADAAAVALRLARTEQQVHALEETDRLRAELLGNVSHELRTPLATILTGTTGLLGDPALSATHRQEMQSIVAETERLAQLVSDVLDMARIEGHAMRLQLIDIAVADAVSAAVDRLHLRSPSRPVVVTVEDGLEATADWGRLGQVLDNLLANADRYAPSDTAIAIEATRGKRGMVVVRVIDHGPGVPTDQRDRVFERFVGADGGDGTASPGNTGLGLAIARGIVEAHAGRIWIEEPRAGEGGRFAFALPAASDLSAGGEDVHVDLGDQTDEPVQQP